MTCSLTAASIGACAFALPQIAASNMTQESADGFRDNVCPDIVHPPRRCDPQICREPLYPADLLGVKLLTIWLIHVNKTAANRFWMR
jgi:hypothetical protein